MSYIEDIQALWYYFKLKTTNTYYRKPLAVNYYNGRVPFMDRIYYFFTTSKLLYLFIFYGACLDIIGIVNGQMWYFLLLIAVIPYLSQMFPSVWLNRSTLFGDCPSHLKNLDRDTC